MEPTPTIKRILVCAALLLGASTARAQSVDDAGLWMAVLAQGKLGSENCDNSRVKWWFDGHLRFLDDADGFNQSIFRPGIGWTLNERSTVWAGYGWIRTSTLSGLEIDEHRIWQQWTWSKGFDLWKFGIRSHSCGGTNCFTTSTMRIGAREVVSTRIALSPESATNRRPTAIGVSKSAT